MIGRSDERGSGISVLAARHDDDDDEDVVPLQCISLYDQLVLFNLVLNIHISLNCQIRLVYL